MSKRRFWFVQADLKTNKIWIYVYTITYIVKIITLAYNQSITHVFISWMNCNRQWYQLIGSRRRRGRAATSLQTVRGEVCRVARTPDRAYYRVLAGRLNHHRHQTQRLLNHHPSPNSHRQMTNESPAIGVHLDRHPHHNVLTTSPKVLKSQHVPIEQNQRPDMLILTTGKLDVSLSTVMVTLFTLVLSFVSNREEIWHQWMRSLIDYQRGWNCREERVSSSAWMGIESTGLRSWRMARLMSSLPIKLLR